MKQDIPAQDEHLRPTHVDSPTIEALGKLSEALETIEDARGSLYRFHRLSGKADLMLDEAVALFEKAGHLDDANTIKQKLIGLNTLPGRWTFQVVEEYDDGYYKTFKMIESQLRDTHVEGRRHIFESEMKETRRTKGQPGHEARP